MGPAKAYLPILALLSLFGDAHDVSRFRAYAHGSSVLPSLWGAYMYRDVWPLATVSLSPADEAEGVLVRVILVLQQGFKSSRSRPRTRLSINPPTPRCVFYTFCAGMTLAHPSSRVLASRYFCDDILSPHLAAGS